MMEKTKIDEIVKVCIEWNNRKMSHKEAMLRIYKINQKYILSELGVKKGQKKCKWCGKHLPLGRLTYCDKEHMNNDRSSLNTQTQTNKN